METKESRTSSSSSSVLDWSGPQTVVIPRAQSGFGFTLRHLVVYPPQSVLGDFKDDHGQLTKGSHAGLSRELSLEPQETIFVKSVKEGSAAHYAGLNIGDRLIAVNGDLVSDKSYREVIAAIHQSGQVLRLLVVPKDEDILQMAYQSHTGDCMHTSTSSQSDKVRLSGMSDIQHSRSSSDIVHGTLDKTLDDSSVERVPYDHTEVRYSYPLSQWGAHGVDLRLEDFSCCPPQASTKVPVVSDSCTGQVQVDTGKLIHQQTDPLPQDLEASMTSNIAYNIPSRSKYTFGLFFPPKSSAEMPSSNTSSCAVSAESLGKRYEDSSNPSGLTKSQTAEVSQKQAATGYRKTSLDENSTLSSSARSRDFFIRYSSDKAASDNRNRYSPRYSAYDRYSHDSRPVNTMSRSQTVSTISPGNAGQLLKKSSDYVKSGQECSSDTAQSHQYIPVLSENRQLRSASSTDKKTDTSGHSQGSVYSEKTDPSTGSRTFVLTIPYGQQLLQLSKANESNFVPTRQRFGTTLAVTRAATPAHIEIQKSIGRPIVSQRKYQFEARMSENNPPSNNGQNRYKTEIERIKTQPKYSSFAVRKASFEQSPEKEPADCSDHVNHEEETATVYPGPTVEMAQPTVKIRKVSAEGFSTGSSAITGENTDRATTKGAAQDSVAVKIIVSPSSAISPSSSVSSIPKGASDQAIFVECGQPGDKNIAFKSPKDEYFHSPCNSTCSIDSSYGAGGSSSAAGLVDSGVWMKSYHSSSDMLDAAEDVTGDSLLTTGSTAGREMSSAERSELASRTYLSAVGSSVQRGSTHGSISSGGVPVASVAPTAVMASSDSLVTPEHKEESQNIQDSQESDYPGSNNASVAMRKKLQVESQEDQASKLHRRTSYLMATARDRTNAVPLEETFSAPHLATDHKPQYGTGSSKHHSSVKLNKFFGEMIPSITEGVEMKFTDTDESPEVIRKGPLSCKISIIDGKKCSDRTWKHVYAVLRPSELFLTRDKDGGSTSSFEDQHIPLRLCAVEFAREYTKKKKNVFRLTTHNDCEYLFQTEDRGMMMCWIQGIKSINEPEGMDKMEESMLSERDKQAHAPVEISVTPGSKTSPQMGHKGRKLSALSFKSKLTSSPSMKRKKSNSTEKDKEEGLKKGWKDRIPKIHMLKKHSDDSSFLSMAEQEVDTDKFQFGVPLEDCFPSPHNEHVPLIVELCTRIVEARGLEVVGVYRVPGNSAAVTALIEEFNRGIDSVNIDNEKLLDINVISSLLKSFFRRLPEPLIPTDMYDKFIEANRYPDEDKRKLKIKRLLHILPPHHSETLKHMAEHLNKVASYGNINKMDAKNLAIMFGPTLVRKKGDDTVSLVTDMSDQCRIVESIILHHEWFFSTWDQDSYIPMETTVETVQVEEGQNLSKDDDEEADSAINTKEIISSIVGAASKKLRQQQQQQQQKSLESLDMVDGSSIASTSTFREQNSSDTIFMPSFTKSMSSITSSLDTSDEFIGYKSAVPTAKSHMARTSTSSKSNFTECTGSPVSSEFSRQLSDDSLQDRNDELEISHGLPSSLDRDAISRLKRIGDDVTALLHTFEQKQLKESERHRREKEKVEREHLRTQLELEQEDSHTVEDWLAWEAGMMSTGMPDLVSSSYYEETFPSEQRYPTLVAASGKKKEKHDKKKDNQEVRVKTEPVSHSVAKVASVSPHIAGSVPAVQQSRMTGGGSHEDIISQSKNQTVGSSVLLHGPNQRQLHEDQQKAMHLTVGGIVRRPPSIRNSLGRRHGSLDSLIDMIDKQEKRSSWASTDSEDGTDLLTSITATFDQKLEILLNPKYKLTSTGKKSTKSEEPSNSRNTNDGVVDWDALWQMNSYQSRPSAGPKQVYTVVSDGPFRDPSLHRSTRSDPKIGIASRFERNDIGRATSSSPVAVISPSAPSNLGQQLDFKTFLDKPAFQYKDVDYIEEPKKYESGIVAASSKRSEQKVLSGSEKKEKKWNLSSYKERSFGTSKDPKSGNILKEELVKTRKLVRKHPYRRHTVGGIEDFVHDNNLSQLCSETNARVCSAFGYKLPMLMPHRLVRRVQGTSENCNRWRGSTPDLSCPREQ